MSTTAPAAKAKPPISKMTTAELQADLRAAQEFLASQDVKPQRTVRRERAIRKELESRGVDLTPKPTTRAKTSQPAGQPAGTAKDLIGHEGPERVRIVGTRATWTTVGAKPHKDGRVLLIEPSKNGRQITRWVDPATQMEKVAAK